METNDLKQFIRLALKLLSTRDHFSVEIISKLKSKGASDSQVAEVVEYLKGFNYLDDKKTLEVFAKETASKQRGVNYFKKKLYEKGALDLFVKDALPVEMEISAARNFVKKCSEKDAGEILKKLLSRGFSPEAAFAVLKEFKKGEILENRSDF